MALSHAQFQTCYYFTFSSFSGPRSKHNQGWKLWHYIIKLNKIVQVCYRLYENPTLRLKFLILQREPTINIEQKKILNIFIQI